jgi:hypothetical protein
VKHPRNPLAQPVTPRLALKLIGVAALVALLFLATSRAWRWWDARPQSVAQQQKAVRKYLEKKSGRDDFKSSYDFSLHQAAATLRSNTLQFRAEVNLLHTNSAKLDNEVRAMNRESVVLTDAERAAKRQLIVVTERLSEQQRRLAARQGELSVLQSNLNAFATNQPTDAARAAARMERLQQQVAMARESWASIQTNVAVLEQQRRDTEQEFNTRHTEAEARRALLATRQAELKVLQVKIRTGEQELQSLRRESQAKEQALANLGNDFTREMRKTIKEAGNYETIYAAIGRWLWTSERLLASSEPRLQRQGAMFSDEAAQAALHSAEDVWLAARICEAQIWPNIQRFDLPGQTTASADAVLGNCNGIFQRAGETQLVEKNYRLMIHYAPTRRRADSIRYNLGYLLEQSGAWPAALEVYREIQDTNLTAQAERRIAAVEQKRSGAQ